MAKLNDKQIAIGYDDGRIEIFDIDSKQTNKVLKNHSLGIISIINLNENEFLSTSYDGTLLLHKLRN